MKKAIKFTSNCWLKYYEFNIIFRNRKNIKYEQFLIKIQINLFVKIIIKLFNSNSDENCIINGKDLLAKL